VDLLTELFRSIPRVYSLSDFCFVTSSCPKKCLPNSAEHKRDLRQDRRPSLSAADTVKRKRLNNAGTHAQMLPKDDDRQDEGRNFKHEAPSCYVIVEGDWPPDPLDFSDPPSLETDFPHCRG